MFDALTEEVEDEVTDPDDNQAILDALDKELAKKDKKKKKKDKKDKKDKKAQTEEGATEEASEEDDGETSKKEKKKKAKKEKKVKITKEMITDEKPKKLPRKMIFSVTLFAGTILVVMLILVSVVPSISAKLDAREAFVDRDYESVYVALSGEKLSPKEQEMYDKAKLIMQLQRKVDSYDNYNAMGLQDEALNALIQGVKKYQESKPLADEYGVYDTYDKIYAQITETLLEVYGITAEEALELAAMEDANAYAEQIKILIGE